VNKPITLNDLITDHMKKYDEATAINPGHYRQGEIECIDALKAATINKTGIEAVCTANAIKYLWRYESKNGLEDVRKAQWYINRLISELEKKRGKDDPGA
jgi:hypothetical protein